MKEIWKVAINVDTDHPNSAASIGEELQSILGARFKVRSINFIWREGLVYFPGMEPVPEPSNAEVYDAN